MKHQPNSWKQTQTLIEKVETHTNINQKGGNTHTNINKKGREIETSAKQLQTNTKGGKALKH